MALPRRALGRTDHQSSILAFGGFALSLLTQSAADAAVDDALARGVNHFDVAPSYGDAELKLAPSVVRYRAQMFLACKTRERRRNGAREELQRSLERLRTDHVDLYQCHAVSDTFDLERLLGPGGAIEAIDAARSNGLTRFVGITGHHCAVLRQALERYPFDTVMFPVNPIQAADPRPATDYRPLLRAAVERGVGVIAIKATARDPWPNGSTPTYATWYRPYDDPERVAERLTFTLTHPVATTVLPGDVRLWPALFAVAERFTPMPAAAVEALIAAAAGSDPLYVESMKLALPAY
jgi:aryl-alcohol dehydrogenase-like predicted oxidoreductase